jgi:hypothetical protein
MDRRMGIGQIKGMVRNTGGWKEGNNGHTQKNGAVLNVNKKCISHLARAQHTLSAVGTVQVSHALSSVLLCLLRGRRTGFQDGVAAGEGFLCVPF